VVEENVVSAWLLREPDDDGVTFRVSAGTVKTIGRAPRADFILDKPLVSRLHCRIEAHQDALEVVDLSSTNGTFVNEQRITRAPLTVGDRLRLGRAELIVARPD
jgi:pSer/pThr/pTyr-binding forkhead associated (FHA) protein